MGTDSTEARATANGFTGLRLMVTGFTSLDLGLLTPEPQPMVLLVQDMWVLVSVV